VNALEDKKGEDIVLLDLRGVAIFADFFVICTGSSDRMLNALAEAALDQAKQQHDLRGQVEGDPRNGWLLADFGDIIVHLFSPDRRDYYRLEELWSQGKVLLHLQ
jgi:ribosome-associated protein